MAEQFVKAISLGSQFVTGCLAVTVSQVLGAPLYLVNQDWYNSWIAFTKGSFGLLVTSMTQQFAPTVVIASGDKSVRGQLQQSAEGNLMCVFPQRLVLIANHQIYTDWLYLWWIAYTNGMHGRLYIILKESLKRIPVIGWGMQLSQFIFLKRNWEKDKPNLSAHLQKLNDPADPMWLMLFPEGTNLAPSTRKASKKWAAKNGLRDMQHLLLPRSTGLQFCLQELRKSVDYVYDCTIAYEGVPRGQYAQDVYTLKAAYLEGNPPKSINMYWRRFAISSIPIDNPKAFEVWLRTRWREKDMLIERFYQKGRFPPNITPEGKSAGYVESQVKSNGWNDFMNIFAPVGTIALVLSSFYGALPKAFMKDVNKKASRESLAAVQKYDIQPPEAKMILGPKARAILEKAETLRKGELSEAEMKLLLGPAGKNVLKQMESIPGNPIAPTQQKRPAPAAKTAPTHPKVLTSQNGAAKRPARKSPLQTIPERKPLSAANLARSSASHLARTNSVAPTSTKAPSVAPSSLIAPSLASVPVRRGSVVNFPTRAMSVAPTPTKKAPVRSTPRRAPSGVSTTNGSVATKPAPSQPVKATPVKKKQPQPPAVSAPKTLAQPAKNNVVKKQPQKPTGSATKAPAPKVSQGTIPTPKKPAAAQPNGVMPRKQPASPKKQPPPQTNGIPAKKQTAPQTNGVAPKKAPPTESKVGEGKRAANPNPVKPKVQPKLQPTSTILAQSSENKTTAPKKRVTRPLASKHQAPSAPTPNGTAAKNAPVKPAAKPTSNPNPIKPEVKRAPVKRPARGHVATVPQKKAGAA